MQKVQRIEAGQRKVNPAELGPIARALGIEVRELMRGLGYIGDTVEIRGVTARAHVAAHPGVADQI